MGVAKSIEHRLEGLVEGFFAKTFRSGLQPIEVGRRIQREMGDGKTVSVNRVYAPNEFRVVMGSDDYGRFSQMEAGLSKEFTDIVIDAAKANRWNLMGLPRFTFSEDESIGKGEFELEASFAADEARKAKVSTHEPDANEPSMTGAIQTHTAERLGLAEACPLLLVLDEDGKPAERISLTKDPVVIGRMSTNDVVLADSNVSRRHAQLERDGDTWTLVDLGSTNGSVVNGRSVREHALKDGDRLSFGTSELVFKTAGGG
jgi:hypothetical protein